MNKEEIEELKEFTIDLTDIDELALGLEVCSKKSNMVIQEFIDTIFQLQQENKQLKEHIEKYEHYCKTTGIEELMKENKKYKEEIDKAIKLIEEIKERRILRLLEMEVLDILKEVE